MKDKNSSVIKFDSCNTIYEIVELMKNETKAFRIILMQEQQILLRMDMKKQS